MTRPLRFVSLLFAIPMIASTVASTAHGHARLKSPTPRDTHSDYKSPPVMNVGTGEPCGVARTASQPSNSLTPGAQITVTFEETVTGSDAPVVGEEGVVDDPSPPVQAAAESVIRATRDATERARILMGCGMIREPTGGNPW